MTPVFGSNDETVVRWELPRLLELGLLQEGEIMCEVEGAYDGSRHGALVVTDLAVHFLSRGVFGPSRNYGLSIGLEEIESVELCDSEPWHRRGSGALVIARSRRPYDPEPPALLGVDRPRYAELLEEGEVPHEIADGWRGPWRPGTLVVTDRRVAFFMGGVLWPHRCVVSIPFDGFVNPTVFKDDYGTVLALDDGFDPKQQGTRHEFRLASHTRADELSEAIVELRRRWRADAAPPHEDQQPALAPANEPVRVLFDGIMGGPVRAAEIVETILRQKEYLEPLGPRTEASEPDVAGIEDETAAAPPVLLGPGVADWVEAHGGRLFVWGDEFGRGFEWMKASIDPPSDVGFVRAGTIMQFELYVERGIAWSRPIRLDRRWFGLRDGIVVDTGLVTG